MNSLTEQELFRTFSVMKHLILIATLLTYCVGTSTDAAPVTFSDAAGYTQSFAGGAATPEHVNAPGKLAEQWAKLWSEKQLDAVVEMYAADGVFLTGQGARVNGREAIRALFKTAFDAINPDLKVHSLRVEQSGKLAYDSGEYAETLTPVGGGAKREGKGNYVMVLRREPNGNWLIAQHIWTDVPSQ
jgi:uncharacterized protein (TIGR02246 family)